MLQRAGWVALVLVVAGGSARAEGPCARDLRETFDLAGRVAAHRAHLATLTERLRARPTRCGPGAYAHFARRYASLLVVIGEQGLTDREREIAERVRALAPVEVPPDRYAAAFSAFLQARARLARHTAPPARAELLAAFDRTKPRWRRAPATPSDRKGIAQGLREIRWQLAQGQVKAADQTAAALLQAMTAPDGGR